MNNGGKRPTSILDLNWERAGSGSTVSTLFLHPKPLFQVGHLCAPHAFVPGKSTPSLILLLSQQPTFFWQHLYETIQILLLLTFGFEPVHLPVCGCHSLNLQTKQKLHGGRTAWCSSIASCIESSVCVCWRGCVGGWGLIPFEMISPLFRSLHHWGPQSFVLSSYVLCFPPCFSFDWKSKLAYYPHHPHTQTHNSKTRGDTKVNIVVRGMSFPHHQSMEARSQGRASSSAPPMWKEALGGARSWQSTKVEVQIEELDGSLIFLEPKAAG